MHERSLPGAMRGLQQESLHLNVRDDGLLGDVLHQMLKQALPERADHEQALQRAVDIARVPQIVQP